MADLPVFFVAGVAFDHAPLDDAVLELVEARSAGAFGRTCRRAVDECCRRASCRRRNCRNNCAATRCGPDPGCFPGTAASCRAAGDGDVAHRVVPGQRLPARQQRRRLRAEIGEDETGELLDGVAGDAALGAEVVFGVGGVFERLLDAGAGRRRTSSRGTGSAGRPLRRRRWRGRRGDAGRSARSGRACRSGRGTGPGPRPEANVFGAERASRPAPGCAAMGCQ